MTSTLFKHSGKCGGSLVIDIADLFSFSTPSVAITTEGIRTGILEIKEKSSGKVRVLCLKCKTHIEFNSPKDISSQCIFCRKYKPITELWISNYISCTCTSCKSVLLGERESDSPELAEAMRYLLLPKDSVKFVLVSDVLQKQ